ncbi:NADAR family protein [Rhodovulum sulfidophilum]|uniref:NADAR family protein n=1 Tax=Rhodovulum sulfidophilum TaxID=35806 RepID=UPI000952C301|nr:NADAR family protein [Rhodovulum sulfidophilum]MBL3554441.1 NADAR family protein [Rhodovulum sulfidophilum]OLS49672.1 hypothetical protein BV379_16230 [Rhodovulum sulfidophilum]
MSDVRFHGANGQFGFLSNFSDHGFMHEGIRWATVEHFYQASKFNDPVSIINISQCETPALAKHLGGRTAGIRADWHDVRLSVMRTGVLLKFQQNKEIAEKLCKITGDIVEVSKDDAFWGAGIDGNGENNLGKILMEARQRICDQ